MYVLVTAPMLAINISSNYYFYQTENYTAVFYCDILMLLVIGIALKLFTNQLMQWCFSYIRQFPTS